MAVACPDGRVQREAVRIELSAFDFASETGRVAADLARAGETLDASLGQRAARARRASTAAGSGDEQIEAGIVGRRCRSISPPTPAAPRCSPSASARLGGVEHHVAHRRIVEGLGDDEDRRAGRMVGPLDEGQAGDDLRAALAGERRPPGAGVPPARRGRCRDRRADVRHGLDHRRGAVMRHVGHREAEMEAGRVAHRRVAAGDVGMDR